MKYTRDQFKTADYLLWEKGALRHLLENDRVYIVKYRTSDDVQSVYDGQGNLLWRDDLPYILADAKRDINGIDRREFLRVFGLAGAALLFGLHSKNAHAEAASIGLSGTASGFIPYVDDVFSAYLYTGNGSTQNITNGIDLAGHGGLVWIKCRSSATGHHLSATVSDITTYLDSSAAGANQTGGGVSSVNSNGFSITASSGGIRVNQSGNTYASWAFRKAPRFFDVVTYTGNGVTSRQISHSLGVAPGMIVIKATDHSSNWKVWHRSLADSYNTELDSNFSAISQSMFGGSSTQTSTYFSLTSAHDHVNSSGATYVAYLFAHDTSSGGIIQCGTFTASSGSATITLDWEPQFVMIKQTNGTDNWYITDSAREFLVPPLSATQKTLKANLSTAEAADGLSAIAVTSTGFYAQNVATSGSYIYVAVRRPNKPPTTGAQVFEVLSTNKGQTSSIVSGNIVPDLAWFHPMIGSTGNHHFYDRFRGSDVVLYSNTTSAEAGIAGTLCVYGATQTGLKWGDFNTYYNGMTHLFRRTPGVFDIVADTGTSSARQISHSLGVSPELIIRKSRSNAYNWQVYCAAAGGSLVLNLTNAQAAGFGLWTNGTVNMNAATFSVSASAEINSSADKFINYLFATKAGISKVGSYTGNGTSQTINCTFTTGARFILIKRTDGVGDWYVWDTVRGIVPNNDQHLSLNTTAAEVATDDSIDVDSSGFIVNQNGATNINTSGAVYIFLAIS